jgi:hypothetical protein
MIGIYKKDLNKGNLVRFGRIVEASYAPVEDPNCIKIIVQINSKYSQWFNFLTKREQKINVCQLFLNKSKSGKLKNKFVLYE